MNFALFLAAVIVVSVVLGGVVGYLAVASEDAWVPTTERDWAFAAVPTALMAGAAVALIAEFAELGAPVDPMRAAGALMGCAFAAWAVQSYRLEDRPVAAVGFALAALGWPAINGLLPVFEDSFYAGAALLLAGGLLAMYDSPAVAEAKRRLVGS